MNAPKQKQTQESVSTPSSALSYVGLALAGIVGYALWRNREKIVNLFQSSGFQDKVLQALR